MKLYFNYSTMNAGKSTNLLQSSFNYKENGFDTIVYTFELDRRINEKDLYVSSRIGLKEKAYDFNNKTDFLEEFKKYKTDKLGAVFIDEAQFLTEKQVKQLSDIVDFHNVPVLCYGLRTDFLGNPFEGSIWLLTWADEIKELKTICETGKKATFVVRKDQNGIVKKGAQIQIGGNSTYKSVSRKRHKELLGKTE